MNISLKSVQKSFSRNPVLTDVTFSVSQGEFVSVIGTSGAGKTTLFRILNGEIYADKGSVCFDAADLQRLRGRKKRNVQKRVGTIYQDFCLVEPSTCIQNVLNAALPDMNFPAAALGIFSAGRRSEAEELLNRVGLSQKQEEPVYNLSGGQKQRCAIARALMRHPDVILADEPVSSLDPVTGRQILALLKELQQREGFTVLMNSHNLAMSLEFSDRIIGLHNGRVIYDGPADEIDDEILQKIYTDQNAGVPECEAKYDPECEAEAAREAKCEAQYGPGYEVKREAKCEAGEKDSAKTGQRESDVKKEPV